MNPYRLYLVTDQQQKLTTLTKVVSAAVAGGVTMVQLREKDSDIRTFIQRAEAVKAVLQGSGVPLIINDRVDVALAVDADGVHLGQSDMDVSTARRLLGKQKLIGLSVETELQWQQAAELPLDYVGLSAIFATATKTDIKTEWGIAGLTRVMAQAKLPVVAIGGIHAGNIRQVADTGVDGIALVSAICHAADPEVASRALFRELA